MQWVLSSNRTEQIWAPFLPAPAHVSKVTYMNGPFEWDSSGLVSVTRICRTRSGAQPSKPLLHPKPGDFSQNRSCSAHYRAGFKKSLMSIMVNSYWHHRFCNHRRIWKAEYINHILRRSPSHTEVNQLFLASAFPEWHPVSLMKIFKATK